MECSDRWWNTRVSGARLGSCSSCPLDLYRGICHRRAKRNTLNTPHINTIPVLWKLIYRRDKILITSRKYITCSLLLVQQDLLGKAHKTEIHRSANNVLFSAISTFWIVYISSVHWWCVQKHHLIREHVCSCMLKFIVKYFKIWIQLLNSSVYWLIPSI